SYPKPAMGYLYAKDILGDSLFLRGIHLYMQDWHGKHPIPLDFFQSMNAGSGVNLDWFWRRWFYENGYPDLAIASVNRKKNTWTVTVANKGGKPLPVDLTIEFEDGSTDKVHRSAAVWEKQTVLTLRFDSDKTVRTVRLGSTYTPDSFPADNVMEVK